MTKEVQNQIIGQFWEIVPTVIIFLLVAAALGIGYKLIEKKILKKAEKLREDKREAKQNNERQSEKR